MPGESGGDVRSGKKKRPGRKKGKKAPDPSVEQKKRSVSSDDQKYPSVQLLANVVSIYDNLVAQGVGWKSLKHVATGRSVQAHYLDLKRIDSYLQRKLITLTSGRGAKKLPPRNRFIDQMRDIVQRVKALREDAQKVRLKVATSPMINLRLLSPLIAAYRDQQSLTEKDVAPAEIDVTLKTPNELIDAAGQTLNEFDVILTFGRLHQLESSKFPGLVVEQPAKANGQKGAQKPKEKLAAVPAKPYNAYRCILARRDSRFWTTYRTTYRTKIENGDFDYAWLKEVRVALLSVERSVPGFPHAKIEQYATVVPAWNSLEAHALVRAGTAEITFTHVDFLSELDLRSLSYIDLGKTEEELRSSCIYAIQGGRQGFGENELPQRNKFLRQIVGYFETIEDRYQQSRKLTDSLKKFGYSYHTTFVNVDGIPKQRWVAGKLDLEACVLQRERQEATRFVGGSYEFYGDLPGLRDRQSFFGKITDLGVGSGRWLWTGTLSEDDAAGFSFAFDHEDLEKSPWLCGTWAGRTSWAGREEIQVNGFMIFTKEEVKQVDGPAGLGEIVRQFRRRSLIRYARMNDIRTWKIPRRIHGI